MPTSAWDFITTDNRVNFVTDYTILVRAIAVLIKFEQFELKLHSSKTSIIQPFWRHLETTRQHLHALRHGLA